MCMGVPRWTRLRGHRWVSILTYSRTFAMLYWTGDALAAALAATACKTCGAPALVMPMGVACVVGRVVLKAGGRAWGANGPCDVACSGHILIVPRVDSLIESAGRMPSTEEGGSPPPVLGASTASPPPDPMSFICA